MDSFLRIQMTPMCSIFISSNNVGYVSTMQGMIERYSQREECCATEAKEEAHQSLVCILFPHFLVNELCKSICCLLCKSGCDLWDEKINRT